MQGRPVAEESISSFIVCSCTWRRVSREPQPSSEPGRWWKTVLWQPRRGHREMSGKRIVAASHKAAMPTVPRGYWDTLLTRELAVALAFIPGLCRSMPSHLKPSWGCPLRQGGWEHSKGMRLEIPSRAWGLWLSRWIACTDSGDYTKPIEVFQQVSGTIWSDLVLETHNGIDRRCWTLEAGRPIIDWIMM